MSSPKSPSSNEDDHSLRRDSETLLSKADTQTSYEEDPITPPEHIITLSSIDHCMPRAYIRVCLAFRIPRSQSVSQPIAKLEQFIRRTVHAVPFLAGYVVPAEEPSGHIGRVEIRFSAEDVRLYPAAQVKHFTSEEMPYTYDELDQKALPPSIIRPDLVSSLPEGTDDNRAPVFRVQANVLDGGLIISIYLHHCVTDGTGLGLIVSGGLHAALDQAEPNTRDGPANGRSESGTPPLLMTNECLDAVAKRESAARTQLSWSGVNRTSQRCFDNTTNLSPADRCAPSGRGCVFTVFHSRLAALKDALTQHLGIIEPDVDRTEPAAPFITTHDVLQAFLWHHMTQARMASLSPDDNITTSDLLIPVNVRSKLSPALPSTFLGSAVDSARCSSTLDHLSSSAEAALASSALAIRAAIAKVDEDYVRDVVMLANSNADVRDLLARNMSRKVGADMYITSWRELPLYDSDLGMGLGRPDWVRKPWSKDPGSCIVLPQDPRKDIVEVVVQLRSDDMVRLLHDGEFMKLIDRVVE